MIKHFSIFFITLLFLSRCRNNPFPKKDTNVIVVTANGVTTKNTLSVSMSGEFDPYGQASANGFPYSASFYIPGTGSAPITMSIYDSSKSWTPANGQTINATYDPPNPVGAVSISVSFANLKLVVDKPTGSPTDTIYASAEIYGTN